MVEIAKVILVWRWCLVELDRRLVYVSPDAWGAEFCVKSGLEVCMIRWQGFGSDGVYFKAVAAVCTVSEFVSMLMERLIHCLDHVRLRSEHVSEQVHQIVVMITFVQSSFLFAWLTNHFLFYRWAAFYNPADGATEGIWLVLNILCDFRTWIWLL